MPKKYRALADMVVAFEVEFDEDEIPAGMDEWEYASYLAEMGEYQEQPNGGDFRIVDVVIAEGDENDASNTD